MNLLQTSESPLFGQHFPAVLYVHPFGGDGAEAAASEVIDGSISTLGLHLSDGCEVALGLHLEHGRLFTGHVLHSNKVFLGEAFLFPILAAVDRLLDVSPCLHIDVLQQDVVFAGL